MLSHLKKKFCSYARILTSKNFSFLKTKTNYTCFGKFIRIKAQIKQFLSLKVSFFPNYSITHMQTSWKIQLDVTPTLNKT